MENDQKVDGVVTENNASEEVQESPETSEATEETNEESESTEAESKPKFTPEELLAIRKREVKKLEKQLGVSSEEKPKSKTKTKSDELDYSQKAYLKVNGVDKEDFEFASEFMRETGKDLDETLGSKYFHAELRDRKEARTVENAVPQRTNGRNNVTPANRTVDYWMTKGDFELPESKPENRELIQKVINARYELKKKGY